MLEIRNLTKVYHSKAGNSVKALDDVSITFPETGMVFILGKSGSGKSTLLNVIGGLDGCDSGEFIIKGKSSAKFAGSDFDAYRNTFIGFIFQEYNVLDDFTVGANIGLALELQGKKATNDKINAILEQVDMLDYAKRKPNELSGGQKQRVAIARALVKDPEIIMADEPTGALDSNTGKQIFDTLKELSKSKLVIVVSHDRDFAERYGDRIIEMQDGKIFSDVTKHEVAAKSISKGILKMSNNLLKIEKGYQLTAEDVALINEYLRAQSADIIVSGDKRLNDNVRSAAGISENNTSSVFDDTDAENDVKTKQYKSDETKFIRSRLPFKNAFKMGTSSLGHKKFRLVMTIFLSLIAFALFGFADTLGAYDKYTAATESIIDSNIQNASFSLSLRNTWTYSDGESHSYYSESSMNDEDIKLLSHKTGIDFVPVFNGSNNTYYSGMSLTSMMTDPSDINSESVYSGVLSGLVSLDDAKLSELGFAISGTMPTGDNEIAISDLILRQFNHTGFRNNRFNEEIEAGQVNKNADGGEDSIIGKHITLNINGNETTFVVTAVIDTNFDYNRYAKYVPSSNDSSSNNVGPQTEENTIIDMIMIKELANTLKYGFHCIGYTTQDTIDTMSKNMIFSGMEQTIGTSMNWSSGISLDGMNSDGMMGGMMGDNYLQHFNYVADSSALSSVGEITWLDGNARDTLGENEIVISKSILNSLPMYKNIKPQIVEIIQRLYGKYLSGGEATIQDMMYVIEYGLLNDYTETKLLEDRTGVINAYKERYGDVEISLISDEELKNFIRECVDSTQFPNIFESREKVCGNIYRKLLEEICGETFSTDIPEYVFSNIFNNAFSDYEDQIIFSQNGNARNLLAMIYAYEDVYANPDKYKTEEFFQIAAGRGYGNDFEEWKNINLEELARIYSEYLQNGTSSEGVVPFAGKSISDFDSKAAELYTSLTGDSLENYISKLYLSTRTWSSGSEQNKRLDEYKIVGFFEADNFEYNSLIISDTFYAAHEQYCEEEGYGKLEVTPHEPGIYAFAIAPMPTDKDAIRTLVDLSYDETSGIKFNLENQVMDTLDGFNDFIEIGAKIFLYVGIGFAVFSALMLMNFISVSISYKRREIGILRAVGARSSDVFKIFFCEAFVIAIINYIFSLAATISAITIFNNLVRNEGINVTLLNFGIRQILLMLVISIFVAAVASFLPVWNIARRKPVDAIKNK